MHREPWKDPRRNKNVHLVFLLVAMTRFQNFLQKLTTDKNCRWLPWSTKQMFKFYEKLKIQQMVLTNPSLQCNPFAFPLAASTSCIQPFYGSTLPICFKLLHTARLLCYFDQIYPLNADTMTLSCIMMNVYGNWRAFKFMSILLSKYPKFYRLFF